MQRFNNALLALAFRGRGYNNYHNFATSGEQAFLKMLSKHNPKVCIDVGANKGGYSEALLALTDSVVIAFEPLPEAFQSLLRLQKRFPNRVIAINEGLADRDAELELHFGAGDSPLASFSAEINEIDYVRSENRNIIKVPVSTLDNFFHGRGRDLGGIDLLKIDTEGFEYEVLLGAQTTITERKPKFVQIEWNWHQLFRGHTFFELASLLPSYIPYQLLPYGLSKRDSRMPESNIYHYSNFVFVRHDISLADGGL